MIQLKNDSIRQAAANNVSGYNAVNTYAQNAYKALDDYASGTQASLDDAYNRLVGARDAQTAAAVSQLGLQKGDAYDTYMQNRAAANQGYLKYGNYNGSFGSKMVESGLSGSGYEQVVKARAFSQKQAQLSAANSALQNELVQVDAKIAQAKAAGDAQKAEYYLQRAQQIADLQGKVADSLNSISSQIYSMNTTERNYAYQVEQDRIAREQQQRQLALAAESNRLAREKFDYEKNNNSTLTALQSQLAEQKSAYEAKIAELEAKLNPASQIPSNEIRYYPRDQLSSTPGLGLDFSWATKK